MIEAEYPEVYRFTTAVFPSAEDDVITSPYNRYHYIIRLGIHLSKAVSPMWTLESMTNGRLGMRLPLAVMCDPIES